MSGRRNGRRGRRTVRSHCGNAVPDQRAWCCCQRRGRHGGKPGKLNRTTTGDAVTAALRAPIVLAGQTGMIMCPVRRRHERMVIAVLGFVERRRAPNRHRESLTHGQDEDGQDHEARRHPSQPVGHSHLHFVTSSFGRSSQSVLRPSVFDRPRRPS